MWPKPFQVLIIALGVGGTLGRVRRDLAKKNVEVAELDGTESIDHAASEITFYDPTSDFEDVFRCSKRGGKQFTFSADKKFVACCLPDQLLKGSPETAFDCCGKGHDIAGSAATGYICCPTGQTYDGTMCTSPPAQAAQPSSHEHCCNFHPCSHCGQHAHCGHCGTCTHCGHRVPTHEHPGQVPIVNDPRPNPESGNDPRPFPGPNPAAGRDPAPGPNQAHREPLPGPNLTPGSGPNLAPGSGPNVVPGSGSNVDPVSSSGASTCSNGKSLINGQCQCPKGTKETTEGACVKEPCSSSLNSGEYLAVGFDVYDR